MRNKLTFLPVLIVAPSRLELDSFKMAGRIKSLELAGRLELDSLVLAGRLELDSLELAGRLELESLELAGWM